ncbi:MAG: sugar ABC transporter ATP-binding protein [Myxococcales bacterium]|nr:sugar ABC transporter ATP-binding protein [Myxococcales bacterium]
MADLLSLRNIRKRFGGVVALSGVDFSLREAEIHALCGENGAGKSTLIKILSGIHPASSFDGEYQIDGALARFAAPADANQAGLSVIYQELALCNELTVAENIFLGNEPLRGLFGGRPGRLWPARIDHIRIEQESAQLLSHFGIALDPRARVFNLGVGQKQLVEIAKALARRSRVLILDEPTAALSQRECAVLLDLLRGLRQRGTACVYVSHKLDEVFAISDRITVLRDGQSVLSQPIATVTPALVVSAMCGRTVDDLFPARSPAPRSAPTVLAVRDLSFAPHADAPPRLRELSFSVAAGEIVGIGGLLGSGRSELLRHLFGTFGVRTSGVVTLQGLPFAPGSPSDALDRGVVLLSEERRRDGLCMDATVSENLSLSSLASLFPAGVGRHLGLLDSRRERRRNLDMATRVRLRSAASTTVSDATLALRARALSGGNQQKIVLGKALLAAPKLLLLDEPTRGVDIGAKQDLYELIVELCQQGLAVVLVSSELPELVGLCDRVLVLSDSRITAELARGEATAEALLLAAATGSPHPSVGPPPTSHGAMPQERVS